MVITPKASTSLYNTVMALRTFRQGYDVLDPELKAFDEGFYELDLYLHIFRLNSKVVVVVVVLVVVVNAYPTPCALS